MTQTKINRYLEMMPKPIEYKQTTVQAFRELAEAIKEYVGENSDVEVYVYSYKEDQSIKVKMSIFVPKTDYSDIILVANCYGEDGFPVSIDPYFSKKSFPNQIFTSQDLAQMDSVLEKILNSDEIVDLLAYAKKNARSR